MTSIDIFSVLRESFDFLRVMQNAKYSNILPRFIFSPSNEMLFSSVMILSHEEKKLSVNVFVLVVNGDAYVYWIFQKLSFEHNTDSNREKAKKYI